MYRNLFLLVGSTAWVTGCRLVCRDGYGLANDDKCYPLADTATLPAGEGDTDTDTDADTDTDTDTDTDADTDPGTGEITAIIAGQISWEADSLPTTELVIGAWSEVDLNEDLWPTDIDMMLAHTFVYVTEADELGVRYALPVQFESLPGEPIDWLNLEVSAFEAPDLDSILEGRGTRSLEGPVTVTDGSYVSGVDILLVSAE